jgi:hypothetical protein
MPLTSLTMEGEHMNNETKDMQVELYQAYTVNEILDRREMLGNGSLNSLSGDFSGKF